MDTVKLFQTGNLISAPDIYADAGVLLSAATMLTTMDVEVDEL